MNARIQRIRDSYYGPSTHDYVNAKTMEIYACECSDCEIRALLSEVDRLKTEAENNHAGWVEAVEMLNDYEKPFQHSDMFLATMKRIQDLCGVLRDAEWKGWNSGNYPGAVTSCPICSHLREHGHAKDCRLDMALRGTDV